MNNSYTGNVNVQILNIAGAIQKEYRLIKTSGTSRHLLSLSMLPKGEYFLVISINGSRESRKFIKL
jgi:endoglucanase